MVNSTPVINKAMLKKRTKLPMKRVDGHTPKMFAILYDNKRSFLDKLKKDENIQKTLKDSLFFGDLFRSLMKKECSYITCMDNDIKGKKKDEVIIPDEVSCLIKELMSEEFYFNEIIGSRLANFLGIDTVYNLAHKSYSKDNYDYLISVDYRQKGYTYHTFQDFHVNFNEDSTIEEILTEIDRMFNRIGKVQSLNTNEETIRKFKEQFVKQYLFKSILCEDLDFEGRNLNFMYNTETGDIQMGPLFDMELLFRGARSVGYYEETIENNLCYIETIMPEVLNDFITRCQKGLDSQDIEKIFTKSIKLNDPSYASSKLEHITKNIKYMSETYNKLQQETPSSGI